MPAVLAIFAVLVVVGYNGKDSWWGVIPHLLALGGLAWGAHDSLSRKCFEHIQKQYPRETLGHYRLNTLLCYVVFPGIFWVIFGLSRLRPSRSTISTPLSNWLGTMSQ